MRALRAHARALADRREQEDFPRPLAELAAGPVWSRQQLVRYAVKRSERYFEREPIVRLAELEGHG